MKLYKKAILPGLLLASIIISPVVGAATSPSLEIASTFVVLSSTYTNNPGTTTLTGDLGYTTGPATAPTVNGNTYVADSTYDQAGLDQGSALSALASQPCDFSFSPGAVDLATDTTHGTVGVYEPGIYCITGAASIGSGTITLDGTGTYIFRIDGALTTAANTSVVLANGASACDVWWTPTQATTLGANSMFVGTDIDPSGITVGDTVDWIGRALAFGGTVTTVNDTISAPDCTDNGGGETPTGPGDTDGPGAPGTDVGVPNTGFAAGDYTNLWIGLAVTVVLSLFAALYIRRRQI